MEDSQIVDLYWKRDENAITETDVKYGKTLHGISFNILYSDEDADECVNDTYNDAWSSMPPHRPNYLLAFLGKIVRRISIDLFRKNNAVKRGGEVKTVLEELDDCVSGQEDALEESAKRELKMKIDVFLSGLPETERCVFVCRYWYMDPIADIAGRFGFSESKVKTLLYRTRKKLRRLLEKEGY